MNKNLYKAKDQSHEFYVIADSLPEAIAAVHGDVIEISLVATEGYTPLLAYLVRNSEWTLFSEQQPEPNRQFQTAGCWRYTDKER